MDALNSIIKAAPLFKSMIREETMLAVTDKEKYLLYLPGEKMKMPDITGLPIKAGDSLNIPLQEGVMKTETVPEHVFGFPFHSAVAPIKDEHGNVIGALGIAFSLERRAIVSEATSALVNISADIAGTTDEIATTSTAIADIFNGVRGSSQKVASAVAKTDDILRFVGEVSSNSNLLGLNAAIEAARAGEQGRGFAVVAGEIRKMADNSHAAVGDIKKILVEIQSEVKETLRQIDMSTGLAERQAAATEEIAASMQTVADKATELHGLTDLI